MAITMGKGKKVNIIDKTIPEILSVNKNVKRLDIIDFCWMLKNIGIDLIEINSDALKNIGKLPTGIDFLYRLESDEDFERVKKNNIKFCIINEKLLSNTNFIKKITELDKNLTVEFRVNSISKLYELKKLKNYKFLDSICSLRVVGLSRFTSMLWIKVIKEIEILLGKNICVCPENKYYNATALSIEGIMNGIENLAVSFTGFGKDSEFAALEEVLFAVKIFVYPQLKIDFTTLPAFVKRFIKLTGLSLAEGKQILGKSVFKLESSINENSLGKNQRLNELYDNALIELQSKLSVGKHSGRKSVIQKLKELGIDVKVDEMGKILSFIRSKSIELKRDLYDNEIIEAISQVH